MLRRRTLTILVPTSTFVFGILVQVLLSQWITFTNAIPISLAVIMIFLAIIITFLELIDRRFDNINTQLTDISNRVGLRAEYVEDSSKGESYKKSTNLIENAKSSIIAVGTWEPFPNNLSNKAAIANSEVINARREFYETIKKQIELHQNDESPFYRRIVQIPEEYMHKRTPFEVDPTFYEHLLYTAGIQSSGKRSCILRRTTIYIKTDFILIDNQYIIIPILTTIKNQLQSRYGEIIINDTHGELARRLQAIYWTIENRAKPIELDELKP